MILVYPRCPLNSKQGCEDENNMPIINKFTSTKTNVFKSQIKSRINREKSVCKILDWTVTAGEGKTIDKL